MEKLMLIGFSKHVKEMMTGGGELDDEELLNICGDILFFLEHELSKVDLHLADAMHHNYEKWQNKESRLDSMKEVLQDLRCGRIEEKTQNLCRTCGYPIHQSEKFCGECMCEDDGI